MSNNPNDGAKKTDSTTPTFAHYLLFSIAPVSFWTTTMMMKLLLLASALVASSSVSAFSPVPLKGSQHTCTALHAELDRRSLLGSAAAAAAAISVLGSTTVDPAFASDTKKVVVAGATGQTGRRILERLAASSGQSVVGAVRNVDKAASSLSESSTVVRGAMVQKVGSVDTTDVKLVHLDVVSDSVQDITKSLEGADKLVIATGFVPGNPLKMNEQAHLVDNVGTIKLVDAAKAAGVKKIVLVSSILTNGRNWGQEKSPGFIVTNAFGNILDEKIVAENYLRKSGLDYTIVRPGGLKAKPPTGSLIISGEDTLNSGEVSRDLVADVCVASLTDPKASNKVLEIIESEDEPPKVFNGLVM